MTDWGPGFAWAEWLLTDYRDTSDDPLERFLAAHSEECDINHQIARCWILARDVIGTSWFDTIVEAGYRELAIQQLLTGPGGLDIATMLGPRPDMICVEYVGELPTWDALDVLDATLFTDHETCLIEMTGPFPVTAQQMYKETRTGLWKRGDNLRPPSSAAPPSPPEWVSDLLKTNKPN